MFAVYFSHVILLLCILYSRGNDEDLAGRIVELTDEIVTANMLDWEHDLAIMFYAPWCTYCEQLVPSWGTIAGLNKQNNDIIVGKFNCEASSDHTDICRELIVDRYPSVYFLGYGNFNQAENGKLLGRVKNERLVRYEADLLPTAINDWVSTMASMSSLHRRWDDFVGIFTGKSRASRKVQQLKERMLVVEKKAALNKKELERYKANEIFDELEDHGDPFVLLHSLPPDEMNLPLRVCVGEMTEEYCRFYPSDSYCKIATECVNEDLVPEECRPSECPFDHGRGCKVVSTCMKTDVIKQYQDALASAQKQKADKGLTILAFPCNNFMGQEPLDNTKMRGYMAEKGITYNMLGHLECENGAKTHPLFMYLRNSMSGGILGNQLKWNFTKFLCNADGVTVKRIGPSDAPMMLEQDIIALLGL